MTTGRNFDELLRVLDSMQPPRGTKSPPGKLEAGPGFIIAGSVSDEDAKKQYPAGWKSPQAYLGSCPSQAVRYMLYNRLPIPDRGV